MNDPDSLNAWYEDRLVGYLWRSPVGAIGGECAGALSILPVERSPTDDRNYRLLSDEEVSRLIAQRGRIHAASSENARPRLSFRDHGNTSAKPKLPSILQRMVASIVI